MSLTTIGIAIIVLVAAWLLTGFVLRVSGALLAFAATLSLATTGNPEGVAMLALGIAAWFAGHWHYALRHHEYKNPLAGHVFCRLLPPRLDPTRDWSVPVALDEPQDRREEGRPAGGEVERIASKPFWARAGSGLASDGLNSSLTDPGDEPHRLLTLQKGGVGGMRMPRRCGEGKWQKA